MKSSKTCPRCNARLEAPDPASEPVRCIQCGATISATSSSPSAPAPVPARRNFLVLAGLVGGLLLICLLPIAGLALAWVFHDGAKKPDETTVPTELAKSASDPSKQGKPPPPPDPRIKIVQPAVEKGVVYLKSKAPDVKGMRAGYIGLNGLALLECGVPPDDPAIIQLAEGIRAGAPSMNQVYDLAAALFFLNRLNESRPLDENDRKMARSFALRIIAGQVQSGIWGYAGVVLNPEQESELLATLKDGTYKPSSGQSVSMSNTQFAMLAIWGARKHGVPVREPLLALAAYFHANQQADGCWIYPGAGLKATSTCAGLLSLAIEVALLEDKEFTSIPRVNTPTEAKKTKADVEKAFAFVAKTIGRHKNDAPTGTSLGYGGGYFDADAVGDLYFLWTLERVGVIYSRDVIGGKDWFDWGYPIVLKAQRPDGSWDEPHKVPFGPLIDTPFALLFLKRANIARDLTEIIRTRGGKEALP